MQSTKATFEDLFWGREGYTGKGSTWQEKRLRITFAKGLKYVLENKDETHL